MYRLIRLSENDYCVDSPAKMGIVKTAEDRCVLIDTGFGKEDGAFLYETASDLHLSVSAILNTHCHPDHAGGNGYLQETTGCPAYAKGIECAYARNPLLNTICLAGGFPVSALRDSSLFCAPASPGLPLTDDVLPEGFSVTDLSGHSHDQVGYLTKDGTFFLGDALASEYTLSRCGIYFLLDVAAELQTIERLRHVKAARFVPSHAGITEDITALCDQNEDHILKIKAELLAFCETPLTYETICKKFFDRHRLSYTQTFSSMAASALRSYLTWLSDTGLLEICYQDNYVLWHTTSGLRA